MNAAIQTVDVYKVANRWFKALMFTGPILGLMMLASGACASNGTEFDVAVTKWDGWVKGNLDKLAALTAISVGSVVTAVKEDWNWFFDTVALPIGIGVIIGTVSASFTAVI